MSGDAATSSDYAYNRIRDELRTAITDGVYVPGALLPSVREIMTRWGVSTTTARRALSELVQGGYARAEGRRGHVCVGDPDHIPTEAEARATGSPSGTGGRVVIRTRQLITADTAAVDAHVSAVDVRREVPPPDVALALQASPTEPMLVRRRVFVDPAGTPVLFRTSYIPEPLADGTPLATPDVLDSPWPHALVACAGGNPHTSATETTARHPTDVEAAALDLRADSAVLVRDDITYDAGSTPLDFTRNVWPGDSTRLIGSHVITLG